MFESQVTVVQFLFFFFIWNADDQVRTAHSLESESADIVVTDLFVYVREWNEVIGNDAVEEFLDVVDKYCANVLTVVKELEPKLESVTLSCDIIPPRNPVNIRDQLIVFKLAMFSSEMEKAYSSDKWFSSLKDTLESGDLSKDSTWITELNRFDGYFGAFVTDDKCSELKNVMSEKYPGLGEVMENCSFDVPKESITMDIKYEELMKIGYCCVGYNIYKRIHSSIVELMKKKSNGWNANIKTGTSEPSTTTVKDENSHGLPSIIRISELKNLKVNYTGHCIYASFSPDWSDKK
uniref:Uncharacterized protein n=1 Tax=Schistosoma mansoni TaxID=6183 RepID=A0A5K4F3M9_SCHMA